MRRWLRRNSSALYYLAIITVLLAFSVWLTMSPGHYARDARTGLCFLVRSSQWSNVPCTPEVNREIERGGR